MRALANTGEALHTSTLLPGSLHRARAASAQALLRVLMQQDGSTTRLLETVAGQPLSVHVIEQHVVRALPCALAGVLPGAAFMRRIATLHLDGQVLLDSISYIALDVLPAFAVRGLQEGVAPIGHLLRGLCTRRSFRAGDSALFEELWRAVGHPDAGASRSLCIATPHGATVVLGETFRQGALDLLSGARPQ